MKDIKDYLHLYLGCDCYYPPKPNGEKGGYIRLRPETLQYADQMKPILRPLSDMTEEEKEELSYIESSANPPIDTGRFIIYISGETCRWFLSKHFDIFGLIKAGLAIDKTKIRDTVS